MEDVYVVVGGFCYLVAVADVSLFQHDVYNNGKGGEFPILPDYVDVALQMNAYLSCTVPSSSNGFHCKWLWF